jgi:hypothetical protein
MYQRLDLSGLAGKQWLKKSRRTDGLASDPETISWVTRVLLARWQMKENAGAVVMSTK